MRKLLASRVMYKGVDKLYRSIKKLGQGATSKVRDKNNHFLKVMLVESLEDGALYASKQIDKL